MSPGRTNSKVTTLRSGLATLPTFFILASAILAV